MYDVCNVVFVEVLIDGFVKFIVELYGLVVRKVSCEFFECLIDDFEMVLFGVGIFEVKFGEMSFDIGKVGRVEVVSGNIGVEDVGVS